MNTRLAPASALLGCLLFGASIFTSAQVEAPAPNQGLVRLQGRQLLRDGKPWIPHGFYQIPFEVPPASFPTQKNAFWQAAYEGYTPAEYTEMRQQGADSVRLQIAQDGANPQNSKFFDPRWFQQAIGAIKAARAAGLTVIVSIQDETQTGIAQKSPLPNEGTRVVWRELAPIFGHDRGVLFELYNEPQSPGTQLDTELQPTSEQWQQWAGAMNETLAVVRDLGAVNVIVADGLQSAQQLTGAPPLNDPIHQVVYAAHPYLNNPYDETEAAWNQKFGNFAETHPVIISEWADDYFCDASNPQANVNFFQYLQTRGIGLEIGIWDFAPHTFHSVVQGFPQGHFSSFFGPLGHPIGCKTPNYGPGKTVEDWFLSGVPPTSPE